MSQSPFNSQLPINRERQSERSKAASCWTRTKNSEVSKPFAISSTSLLKPLFCLVGIAAKSHEVTLSIFVFLVSSLSSVMDIVTWHLSILLFSFSLQSLGKWPVLFCLKTRKHSPCSHCFCGASFRLETVSNWYLHKPFKQMRLTHVQCSKVEKSTQEERNFPSLKPTENSQLKANIRNKKKKMRKGFLFLCIPISFHISGVSAHYTDFCLMPGLRDIWQRSIRILRASSEVFDCIKMAKAVTYTEECGYAQGGWWKVWRPSVLAAPFRAPAPETEREWKIRWWQ